MTWMLTQMQNGMVHVMLPWNSEEAVCGFRPFNMGQCFTESGDVAATRVGRRPSQGGLCPACEQALADFHEEVP